MHNATFNWQYIVVALIVVAAVVYLFRSIRKQAKGDHACGEGSCKCDAGHSKA